MTYQEQLRDPRWQRRRLQILNAADFKCEDCEAHHCCYIRGLMAWEYGIELLMCVCDSCHVERQSKEDAIRVSIGKITRHLPLEQLEHEAWSIVAEMSARETSRLAEAFS